MSLFTGILLHAAGAFAASVCYTPQKKTVRWSWQTYWLLQAAVCWVFLPVVVAWLTIPFLGEVLRDAPSGAMIRSFVLGALYGIGGTAFGLAIRYMGFSVTYAIAVGISCVLGTLLPPLLRQELAGLLSGTSGHWITAGIIAGATGILLCGLAGHARDRDTTEAAPKDRLSFSIGLALCITAGILSAFYGFALDQGAPIAEVAARYGAGQYQGNVIYLFSNSGAFLSTAVYCLYLHSRQGSFREYKLIHDLSGGGKQTRPLLMNYGLAVLTGVLWYTQFFFYGLGHTRMGTYKFTSWAIHMILLVLISTLIGIIMKEWRQSKTNTRWLLLLALITLIVSIVLLTYGNYLNGK